ncbi:unnamed protein product [Amoebophrya sp. A120]|nr:unnamed protein product [Amoebophrya sp. A120]|eukprot:GSA120T00023791001.1
MIEQYLALFSDLENGINAKDANYCADVCRQIRQLDESFLSKSETFQTTLMQREQWKEEALPRRGRVIEQLGNVGFTGGDFQLTIF